VEVADVTRARVPPVGGRVAIRVPTFLAAALAASETDLVATLPVGLARSLAPVLGLGSSSWEPPRAGFALYWHARTHEDEAMRFFRSLVLEVTRPVPAIGQRARDLGDDRVLDAPHSFFGRRSVLRPSGERRATS
jgi:hypothetical protein